MSITLTSPTAMHFSFGSLPKEVRDEIDMWTAALHGITPPFERAYRELAVKLGVSWKTVKRKAIAWRQADGHWSALVNWSKVGNQSAEVSREFLEWYKALAERYQRKTRPAYRQFCALWHSGAEIPGLDNGLPRHELPPGCSYANLQKKFKAFELTVMRQGLGAAKAKHGPKVFSTRVGLWVGAQMMWDDVWHDNFVIYKGQLCRVLELGALDVFSGCRFAYGTQPRLRRADGTEEGLKSGSMRMLIAEALHNHGYSPRGTVMLAEHGTAAFQEALARLLYDRTGGLIKVRESGMTGKEQAIAGMGKGRGGGNPRFKAALESLHNLIHNELAMLPGQTGKDVEDRPEYLHGELEESAKLLKAMARLSPERAALLKFRHLEYFSQFLPALSSVYQAINGRDWHNLEGWHECGHVALDYRLAPTVEQWISAQDFLALPAETQALVTQLAKADQRYLRQRKLSPQEVYTQGRKELVKIPAFVVGEILGDEHAIERKCDASYFEFKDEALHPEPLRYESRIATPNGHEEELTPDKYLTYVNPFDLEQMFIHDAKGRFMGIAQRDKRPQRGDDAALARKFGRVNERLADQLQPVRARHAGITQAAIDRNAHNAAVLSGEPITSEEKERAAQLKANVRKVDAEDMQAIFGGGETPLPVQEDDNKPAAEDILEMFSSQPMEHDNE